MVRICQNRKVLDFRLQFFCLVEVFLRLGGFLASASESQVALGPCTAHQSCQMYSVVGTRSADGRVLLLLFCSLGWGGVITFICTSSHI